jgi:hypothetical protein
LWPLGEKFGFRVETKESPLSKVVVLMPRVSTIIKAQESGAEFEARIVMTKLLFQSRTENVLGNLPFLRI